MMPGKKNTVSGFCRVKMNKILKKHISVRERNRLIFYISVVGIPFIQFCIFYVGVNINSIVMAFQKYDVTTAAYSWNGVANFVRFFKDFSEKAYLSASIKNSLSLYGLSLLTLVLAVFFSYYIFKKKPFSSFYKLMLFMPHIVSSITLILIFKYFTDSAYPSIVESITGNKPLGLISNPDTQWVTIVVFFMWTSMGTQVLMLSGTMSGINEAIIEAAQIDGASPLKEFFYVVLPMVWGTVVTFLVVSVTAIFTNQMALFGFFDIDAPYSLYTFGYFLFRGIRTSNLGGYPYLAAAGLVLTVVSIILTFTVRGLLNKFGPSVD